MKKYLFFLLYLILIACDKVTIDYEYPPLPRHQKDEKPNTPVPLGCIRAYFGDYYRTFTQSLEKSLIDSLLNLYTYGECNYDNYYNIAIHRCDSFFVFSIYLSGYSLDSLPLNQPLPEVYGKYPQINFYPFSHSGWGYPDYYSLAYYNKKCVLIITDKTDDILSGSFDGMLISSTGNLLPISEGEFRIKVLRKKIPCIQSN